MMRGIGILAAAALGLTWCASAAPKWQLEYFYDQDKSEFTLNDLKFPSARTGIAVGFLSEERRTRPAALVTNNGGRQWEVERLKEPGLSLFFLNDSLGWMVTPRGIWRTEEAGRGWKKISSLRDILRVYFVDPRHGWAVGLRKSMLETTDGGATWRKVEAVSQFKGNPDYIAFAGIAFVNPQVGMVTGWYRPPRRSDRGLPDWIDPEAARSRREVPGTAIFLETRDGGKTWTSESASTFGRVTRIQFLPNGVGLGLVELMGSLDEFSSEVHAINWRTGKSERVFRDRNLVVTDIALLPSGGALLAAIESAGRLKRSPIPGKLRVLHSPDLKTWTRMEVDYRATGLRATLAVGDEGQVWIGTDTGMLLKLVNSQ